MKDCFSCEGGQPGGWAASQVGGRPARWVGGQVGDTQGGAFVNRSGKERKQEASTQVTNPL